jgi:uncharacterized membrane protein YfcA
MSIKLRAFSYTAGIFAAMTVGALALVEILKMLPQEWVPNIFAGVLIALLFKFVYEMVKLNLEYKDKLAEIAKK